MYSLVSTYIWQVSKDTNGSIGSCKILKSNLYTLNWLFQGKALHGDRGNKNREKMEGFTPLGLRKKKKERMHIVDWSNWKP